MAIATLRPPVAAPGRLRVLAAGPIVTVPGGYPAPVWGDWLALPVRGPPDAERQIERLVARGAAVIKIALEPGSGTPGWPMLSVAEVRAIVATAHRHGLIVTAHVSETRGVRIALAGRVDELAHMPCETEMPALMRQLARRHIPIVGTLHVLGSWCPAKLANARTFVDAGGELLYGSDIGNRGIPVGLDVEELRELVAAGLSPARALRAATAAAGRELGLAPLGSLTAGAPADLWAVRGNPLRSLALLARPRLVVAGGHVVR
jgi:imidazolonepropionase-like amidohydrolase